MPSVKLLTCLQSVGQKLKLKLFEDRLALQKITYLLEEAGVDLGYVFTWYVHGPYSPSLTRDAYQLVDVKIDPQDLPKLDAEDEQRIERVARLIEKVEERRPNREYWLELLASLDFVAKYFAKGKTDSEIVAHLRQKKPNLDEKDILEAWKLLQDFYRLARS